MNVIITGATGMAGEGVLLECLNNSDVNKIVMVNRKPSPIKHPKLSEVLVSDFTKLDAHKDLLSGYDACFFCAGISSIGMDEEKYIHITYTTTLAFATKLAEWNSKMVFTYISGAGTDSTENGRVMWARVKGRTENALTRLPFKAVYNFRPGVMKGTLGQNNVKPLYKPIIAVFSLFLPKQILSLEQLGKAMINTVKKGYTKNILEIKDIRQLAAEE